MALDFPDSPAIGTVFQGWLWDGTKWGGGGAPPSGGVTQVQAGAGLTATPSPITNVGQLALTVPVDETLGGTGQTAYAQGDILYASDPTTLARLTKNAIPTRYLANTGASGNPAWNQVNLADGVSGVLPVPSGGTGISAVLQGEIIVGTTPNVIGVVIKDAQSPRFLSNLGPSNQPTWSQIPLATPGAVTGVLPVANGGTGAATAAAAPWLESAGDMMTGRLTVSYANDAAGSFLVLGTTRGMRVNLDATGATLASVDNPVTAFTPLSLSSLSPFTVNLPGQGTSLTLATGSGVTLVGSDYAALKLTASGGRNWEMVSYGSFRPGELWWNDQTASATRMLIKADGTCQNTTGTWAAISDTRLKKDVADYTRGLDAILQLHPVVFKYNGEGGTTDDDAQHFGLIAQEVEPVVPEVVGSRGYAPRDAEGEPILDEATEFLTVDPGRLIYSLINSVKTLDARLKTLEAAP